LPVPVIAPPSLDKVRRAPNAVIKKIALSMMRRDNERDALAIMRWVETGHLLL
jgi:hypothetical protein